MFTGILAACALKGATLIGCQPFMTPPDQKFENVKQCEAYVAGFVEKLTAHVKQTHGPEATIAGRSRCGTENCMGMQMEAAMLARQLAREMVQQLRMKNRKDTDA